VANPEKVKDESLRTQLELAKTQLRAANPTEAVRTLADAFLAMLAKHPDLREATVAGRRGRMAVVTQWPRLGANLALESLADGEPRIEFVRDRFAMSEALTYYEFTVDTAVRQGL
jgi:hypothetical protein